MDASQFTVAWICSSMDGTWAARHMLETEYPTRIEVTSPEDTNIYFYGTIGEHKVVVGCLPEHESYAPLFAHHLRRSFPYLKLVLSIGIGGRFHNTEEKKTDHIRLGDVVVSDAWGTFEGVSHRGYIKRKSVTGTTRIPNWPPDASLKSISRLQMKHARHGSDISKYLSELKLINPTMKSYFSYPGFKPDQFLEASYLNASNRDKDIDRTHLDSRIPQSDNNPVIHYGSTIIGSEVIINAEARDIFATEPDVLCFDMETQQIMKELPCLVIRGISHDKDLHTTQLWKSYAVVVAAAYAKELVYEIFHDASPAPSVISEATVAVSTASTSVEAKAAVYELYLLLSNHDGLQKIYKSASNDDNMSLIQFENKIRRSLKSLALNLKKETRTATQKAIAHLIATQARVLANELGKDCFPSEIRSINDRLPNTSMVRGKREHLEKWLKERPDVRPQTEKSSGANASEGEAVSEAEAVSEDEDETELDQSLSSLVAVREFLLTSTAFAQFVSSLRDWQGMDIAEVKSREDSQDSMEPTWDEITVSWEREIGWEIPWDKESFPSSLLRLSEAVQNIALNKAQLGLEYFTGEPWDWWPLSAPKQPVRNGCIRVEWSRPSWRSPWVDISPSLARKLLILYINSLTVKGSSGHPASAPDLTRSGMAGIAPSGVQQSAVGAPASSSSPEAQTAFGNQQASNSALENSQAANEQETTGASQTSAQLSGKSPATPNVSQRASKWPPDAQGMDLKDFHILLCVPRGRQLHYGIMSNPMCEGDKVICDAAFFDELRIQYRKLRGFWRYWFFPRQFDHCHGWRFIKDPPEVFSHCMEFPSSYPYEIDPSPPKSPYQSSMSVDQWYERFFERSRWSSLLRRVMLSKRPRHFHSTKLLAKMPKRVTSFELEDDSSEEHVWGLRAHLRLSLIRVLMWQITLIAGGLAFYVWWLIIHPGDQQNAIIPWTVIVGAFLFFWTPLSSSFPS